MAVTYPRKILNTIGPREVMDQVVRERRTQVSFLNVSVQGVDMVCA